MGQDRRAVTVGTTWQRIVATAQSLPAQPLGGADRRRHLAGVPGCDINELKQYPGTATVSVGLGRIRFSRIGFRTACFDGGRIARSKIKVSGRLSGKWRSRGLVRRLLAPVCARVLADQTLHLGLQNCGPIHGKEKVYGSIP